MHAVSALETGLLIAVGLVAGVVNTLAGGGSLLTVPLLVILGLPGTIANGTNRVGVLVQCLVACWRFDAEGISEFRGALQLLPPIVLGSIVGATFATQIPDLLFERIFAGVMLILLIPMLRGAPLPSRARARRWSPPTRNLVLFAVGIYGGAVQAGVGLLLLFALARGGAFRTVEPSSHTRTQIEVMKSFLDVDTKVEQVSELAYEISV